MPSLIVMNAAWAALAWGTVLFKPHRATSALLMTAINHSVFATVMFVRSKVSLKEMLGLEAGKTKEF